MSDTVGVRCTTCNDISDDWANREPKRVARLLKFWPIIWEMALCSNREGVDVCINFPFDYNEYEPARFMMKHNPHTCKLICTDEYGNEWPIGEEGPYKR